LKVAGLKVQPGLGRGLAQLVNLQLANLQLAHPD